jgi:hypothetical protein
MLQWLNQAYETLIFHEKPAADEITRREQSGTIFSVIANALERPAGH